MWEKQLISVKTYPMVTVAFGTFQAKDYELRQYETAKWVSTVIRGETQKEAMRQGFWKLFHYIQGKNEKGKTCWFWMQLQQMNTNNNEQYRELGDAA